MHQAALNYMINAVQAIEAPAGLVVEIGSRVINGSVRHLFDDRHYVGVDVTAGAGVDVVCDGAIYQPEEPAAVVVCMETLEHASNPASICANAYRILKPGGVCFVTAAGPGRAPHSAVDGGALRDGEWYMNVDPLELRAWLNAFDEVDVQMNSAAGDVYATAIKAADV